MLFLLARRSCWLSWGGLEYPGGPRMFQALNLLNQSFRDSIGVRSMTCLGHRSFEGVLSREMVVRLWRAWIGGVRIPRWRRLEFLSRFICPRMIIAHSY